MKAIINFHRIVAIRTGLFGHNRIVNFHHSKHLSTLSAVNEPRSEKTGLRGFLTRSDTNRAVQP